MLAAFFNLKSTLYYELFSNFMGKGDKESFAHALQAVKTPFSVIKHPVGSVGEIAQQCNPSGVCRYESMNLRGCWQLQLTFHQVLVADYKCGLPSRCSSLVFNSMRGTLSASLSIDGSLLAKSS